MSARSLDGCILRTELREHLVDLTLALRTTQYRRTSDLLQKYARWVDTHIRFPEEERQPTEEEQTKEPEPLPLGVDMTEEAEETESEDCVQTIITRTKRVSAVTLL